MDKRKKRKINIISTNTMPIIKNNVGIALVLEFKIAFPEEEPLSLEDYLKGGRKDIILKAATFFLSNGSQNSKYSKNEDFLGALFGEKNNEFANSVYERIVQEETVGKPVRILNTYSGLRLFEHFFSRNEEEETQTHEEFERNLFKAYLTLNSEFTQKQLNVISSTKGIEDELMIPMWMFCADYPIADKENYDIKFAWGTQMIKSIYLFQFLEGNIKTKPLLDNFLAFFSKATWQDYLKSFLPITIPALTNEIGTYTEINVPENEEYEENCSFIDKLILQDYEEVNSNDFLVLRAKPIYQIEKGKYRIIFDLFLVEKIFKGMYFLLNKTNESLSNAEKFPNWKSFYCFEFSEKILAYNVIKEVFPVKCIKFKGQEIANMGIDGGPDYYVRKSKNIFVFESKDFLIRADKKMSFDYNIYEKEFAKTLYFEEDEKGKEKSGAVIQLINNIRKILKKELISDTDYHYKDVSIYPILITHDSQYDTFGLNKLLNYWFLYELEGLKEEGLFTHKVKPLTLINIDSLIYNQAGLKDDIPLNEVIDKYYEEIEIDKKIKFATESEVQTYIMSKQIPFSYFINNYFNEKGVKKVPTLLNIVAPALFEDTTHDTEMVTDKTSA